MGIMAATTVNDEGAGTGDQGPGNSAWVEEQATKAARRLKLNSSSPATFLCEVEDLIRKIFLRGLEESKCLCEQMAEDARGVKADGKPYSWPLRPSKCLFSTECAKAIEKMAEEFRED